MPARAQHAGLGSPVSCPFPQPAALVRLVAFAHAGGSPQTFRHWADELAPDVELWHATLPGRAARQREPFARAWPPLVDDLVAAIRHDVPAPVALLGHSLGALLAFEVARGLTRTGASPAHLIVSGRAAPDIVATVEVPATDDELLRHAELVYGGVPDAVRASRDVLEYFLPILRADLELAQAYVPAPGLPLMCPITAMAGDADPIVRTSGLAGWSHQTEADCEIHVLPGGHFFLFEHEAAVVSTILSRLLG